MKGLGSALACAAIALAACTQPQAPAPDVVANLGERELTYTDFESYLRMNSLEGEVGLASAVLSGLFDQFLLEELLLALAEEKGLAGRDRRLIIDELVTREAAATVGEESLHRYFDEHPGEFDLSERVSVRQILVTERAEAETARRRLLAGDPFEEVARSVQEGDDIGGWEQGGLTRQGVPDAFADAIFSLEVGEISEIVEAEYGFLIFEVTQHQPEERLDFDEAAPRIRRILEREAADAALANLADEALQRYNVAVFEQNLPFDYRGNYRQDSAAP